MKRFPQCWRTALVQVVEPTVADTDVITAAFNEVHELQCVDPAFARVATEEIQQLLKDSKAATNGLQLQALYAGQELLGYFHVMHEFRGKPTLFISMLFLRPSSQRRAFGTQIVANLIELARERGYDRAWLKVSLLNWPAIRFWTKLGFRQVVDVTGDSTFTGHNSASLVLERLI